MNTGIQRENNLCHLKLESPSLIFPSLLLLNTGFHLVIWMDSEHLSQVFSRNILPVTQEGIMKIKVLNHNTKLTYIFF